MVRVCGVHGGSLWSKLLRGCLRLHLRLSLYFSRDGARVYVLVAAPLHRLREASPLGGRRLGWPRVCPYTSRVNFSAHASSLRGFK